MRFTRDWPQVGVYNSIMMCIMIVAQYSVLSTVLNTQHCLPVHVPPDPEADLCRSLLRARA